MRIAAAAAASILLLAACGSSGGGSAGGAATAAPAPATVKTADNAKLGKILVSADGRALYTFDKDTKDTSNCYDACEKNWPPLTVTGTPSGGSVGGTFATAARKDGTKQVTLDGKPLYFYTPDKNPGDVLGDGVGGVWHVVKIP